jgi:hypothetical protein
VDALHGLIARVLLLIAETENMDLVLAAFQICKFPRKIIHVNARTPIDMRRIFIRQQGNPHKFSLASNS